MSQISLIIPASIKADADTLAQYMGWADPGAPSYTIPLSADGSEPATHWGLHIVNPPPVFLAMLDSAAEGEMPTELAEAGYPEAAFLAIMGALLTGTDGFDATVASHDLTRVKSSEL